MAAVKKRLPFYNYSKLFSFNGMFNFCVGGRGLGKTYGAKKKAIKDGIRKGDQFIYLRRYKTEMTPARNTFFADIGEEFPDHDLRIFGDEAQCAHSSTRAEKKRKWTTIGYFVCLSTALGKKSVAYPKVKMIIFDEFIIETGSLHYLNNEVKSFLEFYSTVDRWTDKTRVLFLANSVSIMNPYFLEWEIRPDEHGEWCFSGEDDYIVAHFPDAEEFSKAVYETKFGKFIKNTDYAQYAVGNKFSDNHEHLVDIKPQEAAYRLTLETNKITMSLWSHDGEWYAQQKLPKDNNRMFTLVESNIRKGVHLLLPNDKIISILRSKFRQGLITFDSPQTRNSFIDVGKR